MRTLGKGMVGATCVLSMAVLVAGCGTSSTGGAGDTTQVTKSTQIDKKTGLPAYNGKATITFWSWVPNDAKRVQIFEKYYPNIKVKLEDVGAGSPEYTKLSTAIQAKSGAPDVVMLEYDMMPQFIESGGLADITQYVDPVKSKFPTWVMNQVSSNGKVYAVPEDTGPLGLYYQKSIFDQEHLSVPTTWAQFQTEAEQFHQNNPNQAFSYFATNDGQWQLGLLWAAGITPFQQTSDGNWKISLDSPQAVKVFQYWGNLIKSGAVEAVQPGTPSWEKEMDQGKFATVVGSAWYPSEDIVPWDKHASEHDWHAAFIPQWTAGQTVDGDWGGSADAVTTQSKYPEAAAIFADFINTSQYEQPHNVQPAGTGGGGLFPADKDGFSVPSFSAPDPSLGGQTANKDIFETESSRVDANWQWNPWSTYTFQELQSEVTNAVDGKESWQQALTNAQNKIVAYAKSQGYNVQG
ncbi:ABC transporter substrate-binding protein [Alicyclobacillus fastidiosus]|uniref:Extracellular solute-binding protein n=1 Tax=Alicyclobacillus fastidiosus TaxID=392011 RepID=A0ABV5AAD8_9BACL|nr:extracellular solute-binding protein [Alicyclobacillus fastidiosus]WEH10728.1 extracellular solute-binding protein [Alicyclobacillus fastidiosus]